MFFFLAIWLLAATIQIFFWAVWLQRLCLYKTSPDKDLSQQGVSVIICARNERANLQKYLEEVLTQDYPLYEVIVVNDASTDDSAQVLNTLQEKYTHLKVVTIQEKQQKGKKAALTSGIYESRYDWLLLTDADCSPASDRWIHHMMSTRQADTQIVLGYSPYIKKETWVNRWVQFETTYVAIQYFSFALWGIPYMGVGRNLLYHKPLFITNNGFEKHSHINSGDDDLFVNETANGKNTKICLHPKSITTSLAPENWAELYHQKARHFSSSSHYKFKLKAALGLLSLSVILYNAGIIIFWGLNIWNLAVLMLIMTRTFFVAFAFIRLKPVLNINISFGVWLAADFLLPIYYLLFARATRKNPEKWGSRQSS